MSSSALSAPSPQAPARAAAVRAGIRIELATIAWMLVESALALGAGIVARSVLLTAFGLDSVIELFTGSILLWRLVTEAQSRSLERIEQAERRAAWVIGISLCALCLYVVATSALSLITSSHAETSPLGIALAIAALVLMPVLAWRKRVIATQLNSAALRGDAACSITCAYMAGALLVGLGLNALFGWWWADSVAALVLLYWLTQEAREALEGARAGRAACSCGDDDCDD